MNSFLSYFMPQQQCSQRDTKIKHNTSQNFKPESQASMLKRQSQILDSNQIIQKTDIIKDTRYTGLKKKKYCDSAQFFTLSSEIADQDAEFLILLLCTEGQYVGNLSGQGQKVLKANCHFAICQKKSKQLQKQPDLERIQGLRGSTLEYAQKQQQLKPKHLEKNRHLYFIIFQLEFDMGTDNPVQIIEKGHLFPILEYYASSNHKNSNQSFQLVMNSLSKYLDLKHNTFQLPILAGNQEQNLEQTIYKYKFKDSQDFQSVVFFISKRLQDLFQVQQNNMSYPKQQCQILLNGQQQNNDQRKRSEMKNHCVIESNQIMNDEGNHFEMDNFSSHFPVQIKQNKAQDMLIKINGGNNWFTQLRQCQKLEDQYQHAVLQNQNPTELNLNGKIPQASQIDSIEEKQLKPIERQNNFIQNNEIMNVEINNQDLSQKKQNMETLINLPENHESVRQIEEVIQKKQCKQVVSYRNQNNLSDQFNNKSAHADRNENEIDLIEVKDKKQLSEVISNHSMSQEKENIQKPEYLNELKDKLQYPSQITTVNIASEHLPQSNYFYGNNLQQHQSFLPKKLDFKDEQVVSNNNQEINEIEAMQDEDFENYKIDEQLEEQLQKGYESGDEMQRNRNSMNQMSNQNQNYSKDHFEVKENQVVKSYRFVQEPKDAKQISIDKNDKNQAKMLQINYQILYQVVKRTETPNNVSQSCCEAQIDKTTYSLVRTPQTNILCLQILKQKCMTTETQQSKKQPFKLILYNPLVLDPKKIDSNKLHNDSQFLAFVHDINAFEINDTQTKILFYSTKQKSLPLVLQFDIKEEKFIKKYNIRNSKFSLKQVKYFPENKGFLFIVVNKFQILLVPQQMNDSCCKADNGIRVLTYRKNITQEENQWAQFQCFDLHLNGTHLVAGVDGRYVKIFDLKLALKIQSVNSKGKQNLTASKQKTYQSGVKKPRNLEQNKQLLMTNIPSKTKIIQKNHPTGQKISVSSLHQPCEFFFLKALNSYDLYNNQNILASFSRSNFMYDINSRISNIKIVYEKVNSQQISKKAQKILCKLENGDKFLIDCKEFNERREEINCFDNKLRIGNRSLIKQINYSEE